MNKIATEMNQSEPQENPNASSRKRQAILAAAEEVFLRSGYLGTNMDELAALALVSKQTIYKHFGSKEALFIEVVMSMTGEAGDLVQAESPTFESVESLTTYLYEYAHTQLTIVLTPHLMQLRRLVIGEVSRFPELAKVLYERGPQRAIGILSAIFEDLSRQGLLKLDDPLVAASHFNWLVMADPVNRVMLMGDSAILTKDEVHRHVVEGVRIFLAAYGVRSSA